MTEQRGVGFNARNMAEKLEHGRGRYVLLSMIEEDDREQIMTEIKLEHDKNIQQEKIELDNLSFIMFPTFKTER